MTKVLLPAFMRPTTASTQGRSTCRARRSRAAAGSAAVWPPVDWLPPAPASGPVVPSVHCSWPLELQEGFSMGFTSGLDGRFSRECVFRARDSRRPRTMAIEKKTTLGRAADNIRPVDRESHLISQFLQYLADPQERENSKDAETREDKLGKITNPMKSANLRIPTPQLFSRLAVGPRHRLSRSAGRGSSTESGASTRSETGLLALVSALPRLFLPVPFGLDRLASSGGSRWHPRLGFQVEPIDPSSSSSISNRRALHFLSLFFRSTYDFLL